MLSKELLKQIDEFIDSRTTSYIVAPTGTGKSREIPPAIVRAHTQEKGKNRKKKVTVMVAVPARVAAISLARGVKESNPDISVGFAADREIHYNQNTQIVYATYGHVKNKLRKYIVDGQAQPIPNIDYLIVDESHKREIDSDMIVILWQQFKDQGVKVPKLIFASATAPANTKFDIQVNPKPEKFVVKTTEYRVHVEYLTSNIHINQKKVNIALIKTKLMEQHARFGIDQGPFLVFLPGQGEVEDMRDELKDIKDMWVLAALGNMKKEEVDMIFEDPPKGQRKVVLATNIVESAITIDDLLVVIDSMFERRVIVTGAGNNKLELHLIAKDSADQRKGRTGRKKRNITIENENGVSETYDGFVVRVISEADYYELEDTKLPEIERVNIDKEVIEFFSIGIDPRDALGSRLKNKVTLSIEVLKKIKALSTDSKGKISVTDLGDFIADLPIGVKLGAILYFWIHTLKLPAFPCMVLCVLIDNFGPSYFWYPSKTPNETAIEYAERLRVIMRDKHLRFIGKDDLGTLLNMWQHMARETGYISPPRGTMIQWCNENNINNKKLRETTSTLTAVYDRLEETVDIKLGPFDVERVIDSFVVVAKEVFKENIMRFNGKKYVNSQGTFNLGGLKYSVPRNPDRDTPAKNILAVMIFNVNITLYADLKISADSGAEKLYESSSEESSSEEDAKEEEVVIKKLVRKKK